MSINWKETKAAIVRHGELKGVKDLLISDLDALVSIDRQKEELLKNTLNFLNDKGANHALLWGEMGCGKSSLVRAVFCKFMDKNLRLIEISKFELVSLYEILEEIRANLEFKFIIFCDDFSFEASDSAISELKNLLEGSIQAPPKNALFYATSNRKHLVKSQKNHENYIIEKESNRENLSLADRFGLQISFYEMDVSEYMAVVKSYFDGVSVDEATLKREALAYASSKGVRSARSARQFWLSFRSEFEK
ncbi:ATPase (AAA+ superfamily, DUF815 domain) [Campylobacter iguaniorum]|uniref:DUF815 domain-containing protein n=1 Tax=Campylobacter iguaniorum TaxID=1244531 RepID=UPI00073A4EBE|nr:DUF815 domain-containing protein [Campylobacter iguaniorum]ALV24371.1 ATPase (AAA+ superfamily, DUF815 domain) [Campylobacter iguaniorum]